MKNKNIALIGILVIACMGMNTAFYYFTKPKFAYVKSGVLINDFKPFIKANQEFQEEMNKLKSTLDSANFKIRSMEEELKFGKDETLLQKKEKLQEEITHYRDISLSRLEEKKNKLTQDLLKEMNTRIQEYGKSKGYKFIFGTTNDGSILYAEQGTDITDEVLTYINK